MDYTKIITSLIPLLLVAMWWVIDSMNTVNRDIHLMKSHMAHLITPDGQIVPSTGNMVARQELKEELVGQMHDLDIRLKLLEQPKYITGNSCGNKMYSDFPCMRHEGCIKVD